MASRSVVVALAFALLGAACSGDDPPAPPSSPDAGTGADASTTFSAQVASSDLAAGSAEAVQIGVFSSTSDAGVRLLTFGEIEVSFSFLGADGGQPPVDGPSTSAEYVPAPTTEERPDGPTLSDPAEARGVYQTPEVTFPDPGLWNAIVTASVDGGEPVTLEAAFNVYPEHRIPAPGDEALATENLTVRSRGVPASAIDSRAQNGADVPDPQLHRTTIADAIERGRPALVQFATPAYCVSRFCGPTVEAQARLAARFDDVAEFIHVEIWKKRTTERGVVNDAAAEWLFPDDGGDLTEPWLYLIDADGIIVERWGPLFPLDEVEAALDALRS